MRTKLFTLGAAGLAFLTGCASQPVALSPIGPAPEKTVASGGTGYLQVYSDTEMHMIGENSPYYPHTGYEIYRPDGVRLKYVPNHIGNMDESPTLTRVPSGSYSIVAQSAAYGRVTIPVVIADGRRTILHLDRQWKPAPGAPANSLVHLPDGEAVGWRGATARSTE